MNLASGLWTRERYIGLYVRENIAELAWQLAEQVSLMCE
jgi:hypothetical protein